MAAYFPRIVDKELDILLASCPAISIEGARGVGKTATALRRADTVHRLDNRRGACLVTVEKPPAATCCRARSSARGSGPRSEVARRRR